MILILVVLINFKNVITIWAVDNKKQDKKPLF